MKDNFTKQKKSQKNVNQALKKSIGASPLGWEQMCNSCLVVDTLNAVYLCILQTYLT